MKFYNKFYFGWMTGFLTACVPVVFGFEKMTLGQLGWLIIPLTIGVLAFYFGMNWLADWVLGKDKQ